MSNWQIWSNTLLVVTYSCDRWWHHSVRQSPLRRGCYRWKLVLPLVLAGIQHGWELLRSSPCRCGTLAFFARRSTPPPVYSRETTATPIQTDSAPNETAAGFDRAKWNALLRYDKDIALIAEKLQPLGEKWVDEFASSYLALNDKTYLPQIEEKLVAAAKAEAEENERQRIHEEEQQTAFLQEQERLVQARKQQSALRRNRFWGTPRKKFLTIACGVVMALLAVLSLWQMKSAEPVKYVEPTKTAQPKTYSDPFAYCEAVVNKDGGPEGFEDIRYTGPNPPPAVINAMNKAFPNYSGITVTWRCMDANVYGCFVGASGRGCRIAATDERQLAAIKQFCEQNPNNDFVPNAVNYSDSDWRCDGTTPVKLVPIRLISVVI